MVVAVDPSADADAIARLREHTGGNPFHLSSLLRQYGFAELAAMRALPAPAELAQRVNAQLAALGHDGQALAHASAVLGYTWQDLATLAAVGGVQDPAAAAEASVRSGLFVSRGPERGHRCARRMPWSARRSTRRSPIPAGGSFTCAPPGRPGTSWRRWSIGSLRAATTMTPWLMNCDQAAERAHGAGEFSQAGQLLRWSSRRTTDPATPGTAGGSTLHLT